MTIDRTCVAIAACFLLLAVVLIYFTDPLFIFGEMFLLRPETWGRQ